MAHAYTPGLKVTARTRLRKARLLSLAGEVLVARGARVAAPDMVAQAELPGQAHPVNVAGTLGVRPSEIGPLMLKALGESVAKDEPIAETRPWLRFLKAVCRAPAAGTVESISDVTGQVMLREPPQKVGLKAYVSGTVAEVMSAEGVVIETEAALVQGIFGIGGECTGPIKVLAREPGELVAAQSLDSSCENCIIVVGEAASAELLAAAARVGASAVVAGAIAASELKRALGHDIGVAVTGAEQIGVTLVLTEGFGRIPIARRTFDLLAGLDGRAASACGATQIRAGVLRPEIIVPLAGEPSAAAQPRAEGAVDGLAAGASVRIIRRPHFGCMGEVVELIHGPVKIETEATVRALRVKIDGRETLIVPRANVEIIED